VNKKIVFILIIILTISFSGYGLKSIEATLNSDDPLISLSYLNNIIDEIKSLITKQDTYISDLENQISILEEKLSQSSGSSETLEVVEIYATYAALEKAGKKVISTGSSKVFVGTKIIAEAGTEIILRGTNGATTAIASNLGGLSNVTNGSDIKNGENIPSNHLLLIPRSDGRGINVSNYAIFIIRGKYTVQ
jgi:uncharacterized coiled-coil protein SlyX